MGVYVQESFINASEGYRFGDSDVYETYCDTAGELFKQCQREYGRCVSSVYVDNPEGGAPKRVGWVFVGKQRYEDTNDEYLREVWVTVHEAPPEHKTTYHYAPLGGK